MLAAVGATVLALTAAEALYAEMGHFCRRHRVAGKTVLPTPQKAANPATPADDRSGPAMPAAVKRLFAGMTQASGSAAAFFNLPDNAVVELGARVRI